MTPIKIITSLSPARWQEYRQLRLQALQTDPSFFSRTFAEDASLPNRVWQDHLIAAQQGKKSSMVFAQSGSKLVGMVGALVDQGEMVNHRATIISFYVEPAARSQELSKKLLQTLLDSLSGDSRTNIVQIKTAVNVNATAIIDLYESLGFKKVGTLEKSLHVGIAYHDEYLMVKIVG